MFNLGAGEVLVILLLALIVLGPQRLPDAARQVGRFTSEIRKLSSGFQAEMKAALEDESEAQARARGAAVAKPVEPVDAVDAAEPVASAPADSAVPDDDDAAATADEAATPEEAATADEAAATDDRPAGDGPGDDADHPA